MDDSIAQFPTQPTFKATSPSSHFLLYPHLSHLMITLHSALIQILTQTPLYIILISNLITPISKPCDHFDNSEPSPSTISKPPFQPLQSQIKLNQHRHFHLTSAPSNSNYSPTLTIYIAIKPINPNSLFNSILQYKRSLANL